MRRIAVYGTLRKGLGNYRYLLVDDIFLGTQRKPLLFEMVSLGGFPGLLETKEENLITLEVFEVSEASAQRVDSLEGYPYFYNRKEINTDFGKAWIYYLNRDHYEHEPKVEEGDWAEFINKGL